MFTLFMGLTALASFGNNAVGQVSLVTDNRLCSAYASGDATTNPGGILYPSTSFSLFNGNIQGQGYEYLAVSSQQSWFDLSNRVFQGAGAVNGGGDDVEGYDVQAGAQSNFTFSVGPVTSFTFDLYLQAMAIDGEGGWASSGCVTELRDSSNNLIFQYIVYGQATADILSTEENVTLDGGTYTFKCYTLGEAEVPQDHTSPRAFGSFDSLYSYQIDYLKCMADFNSDGIVDIFDYLDFGDAYSISDPSADVNGDSVVDFFDYLDFVDHFSAGC